jgi:hypothetical protein
MGLRATFTELNAGDSTQQRNLAGIANALRALARAVPQDFDEIRTFTSQTLQSGSTLQLKHGLGREPRGWFMGGLRQVTGTPGVAYEASGAYPNNDRASVLRLAFTSGTCTATVYVY